MALGPVTGSQAAGASRREVSWSSKVLHGASFWLDRDRKAQALCPLDQLDCLIASSRIRIRAGPDPVTAGGVEDHFLTHAARAHCFDMSAPCKSVSDVAPPMWGVSTTFS
jgi:hypothetical protein